MKKCVVYALDISISMNKSYSDLIPSKLAASKEAILLSARRIIEAGGKIGLVLFAGRAFPVLVVTNDINLITETLPYIKKTFEASAPGDAIIEAVKLLLNERCIKKEIIMLSDGEYNTGVPLEAACLFARNSKVSIKYVLLGSPTQAKVLGMFEHLSKIADISHYQAGSKHDLFSLMAKLSTSG